MKNLTGSNCIETAYTIAARARFQPKRLLLCAFNPELLPNRAREYKQLDVPEQLLATADLCTHTLQSQSDSECENGSLTGD
jgi:hypothetical protein